LASELPFVIGNRGHFGVKMSLCGSILLSLHVFAIRFTFRMPFGFSSEGDPQNPVLIKGLEEVTGYYVHDAYNFSFMAHKDGEVHSSLFLCDLCPKWYASGGTFGNCKKALERKHSGLLKPRTQKNTSRMPPRVGVW
jgi:hypothetical protein